jgi:sugar phosphate isomerase/epimerase
MAMVDGFGMDTITLNGTLEGKLSAMRDAGFTQVMVMARDLVSHPGGVAGAAEVIKASGLRPTGFQVLRDFEGLSGHLHDYKVDIAKSMIAMCAAIESPVLLACSSTSRHATEDWDQLAQDLKKLAMLALPFGIKIAYEALSWGRTINEYTAAWDLVCRADLPNLGIGLDSFHMLASDSPMDAIDDLDPERIFLVQLSDFMWNAPTTFEERINTARTFRVFPGEGIHTDQVADMVLRLERLGYEGDYSFEVFNDDYQQMPLHVVAARASKSAAWLHQDVLHRGAPLPDWVKASYI